MFYFFNVGLETLWCIYILYVPKKKIIFSMWDLKPFSIYSLCSQEKSYLFNVEFEAF